MIQEIILVSFSTIKNKEECNRRESIKCFHISFIYEVKECLAESIKSR